MEIDGSAPDKLPSPTRRLASIDAYRGFVMFLLIAESLHFAAVAKARPESKVWAFLAHHQEHVEWIGCTLHDMIQPSFSFLVGAALPFSLLSRAAHGQTMLRRTLHAFWRAFVLVALGIFLRSMGQDRTNYTFEDTLTQIGLGYGFLYILATRSVRVQVAALVVILVGYWAAFALYNLPEGFEYAKVGVPADWKHLMTGFRSHWNKNGNLAWRFDTLFMNLFPRKKPFEFNGGGYSTLSFIPTLGTMILGLLAGGVLARPDRRPLARVGTLLLAGLVALGIGYSLGEFGVCPVVKRIWTPSWTLFSGGWCLIALGLAYAVLDAVNFKAWAYPLMVIGANSIAAYLMTWLFKGWIASNLKTHLGRDTFKGFGAEYEPTVLGAGIVLVMWLMLFWMYRRKIFLRV
jgi:heparan-alpha-glucosaminide N-acetyltransferase